MVVDNDAPVSPSSFEGSASEALEETAHTDVVEIPLVGRIAAGSPVLAEQNIEDSFPVPSRFVSPGTNFMLTVKERA